MVTGWPSCTASTVQRASTVDQCAEITLCPNRISRSMPYMAAVSRT
ncbi:hypothetical protein [Kutzneria sp. NPDC051319]